MADDIRCWLEGLGLGKYAEVFTENEITFHALPHLTDDDLKELGLPMGPRKIVAAAIASLAVPPARGETGTALEPRGKAERRQLTIVFSDLVGSTALASRLDPEELRHVIGAYQQAVVAEVTRCNGQVAKYMGDGVVAYFGWPLAHEDDAEQAVRAGLAVCQRVEQIPDRTGGHLQARIGVATGLVVVGELVGDGVAQEEAVIGPTPNLAARLQTLAPPSGVVIASSTRDLLGGLFDLAALGPHELKGIDQPVDCWRVLGERSTETRFEARGGNLAIFVGREHELSLLEERWDRAQDADGQLVLLSGEAGIGKSRVARALVDHAAQGPHSLLRYQCSPNHRNTALHPFSAQVSHSAHLLPSDSAAEKLAKLEAFARDVEGDGSTILSLLAALLSVPTDGTLPALDLTPKRQMQLTMELLLGRMLRLAEEHPVLAIVEDLHWADATTLELMAQIADSIQHRRILLLATFRPEFQAAWACTPNTTSLSLAPLSRQQTEAMIHDLAVGAEMPAAAVDEIIQKTSGVPLFVEELTKAILEAGGSNHAGTLDGGIPSTLHDSLMARLDRLGPAKELAQAAAVIGREFSSSLLTAILAWDAHSLDAALDQVVRSALVLVRQEGDASTYAFKHALIQDAAYSSLLRADRQRLHRATATALQRDDPGFATSEPEILAHHLTESGRLQEAIGYWQRAGDKAAERSTYMESVGHLNKGLSLVPQLPEPNPRLELALQQTLGNVYRAAKGTGSLETTAAYERARQLCEELGETETLIETIYGLFINAFNRPDFAACERFVAELSNLADRNADRDVAIVADFARGLFEFEVGELAPSLEHLNRAFAVEPEDRRRVGRLSQNQVSDLSSEYIAWCLHILGFPAQAVVQDTYTVTKSADASAFLYVMALSNACYLHRMQRNVDAIDRNVKIVRTISDERGIPNYASIARLFEGWLRAYRGDTKQGIALMQSALTDLLDSHSRVEAPFKVSLLAEAFLRSGDRNNGLQQIHKALDLAEQTGERWYEAELHRLKGELLLLGDAEVRAAETAFERALDIARAQSARSWELRAAMSLARLWLCRGNGHDARDLLEPVYAWFTEGHDTADLQEAQALLAELA